MFRFHLIQDQRFQVLTNIRRNGGRCEVLGEFVSAPVRIQPLENTDVANQLRTAMNHGESRLNVTVGVLLDRRLHTSTDSIKIRENEDGTVFTRLTAVAQNLGLELKMRVKMSDLKCCEVGRERQPITTTNDVTVDEKAIEEFWKARRYYEGAATRFPNGWKTTLFRQLNGEIKITGKLTVTVSARQNNEGGGEEELVPPALPPPDWTQKLLTLGVYSDAVIVSNSGERIPCHTFILSEKCQHFRDLFADRAPGETPVPVIQMNEAYPRSVNAFLQYVYFDELELPKGDSVIAFDLYKAGVAFRIPELEVKMKALLLSSSDRWCNVEVAMKLYFQFGGDDAIKKKSITVMKMKYGELNELPAYAQLFRNDPATAQNLCADLMEK